MPRFRNIRITVRVVDILFRSSSIAKSESIVGVKADRLVKVGDGSVVVAFVHIQDASVPKGASTLGVKSDRLAKVGEGSVIVAFVHISDAPVPKGEGAFGIESDCRVKINNGSIIIAFVCIDDTSVPKGVGTLGIKSNRLIVIGERFVVIAFVSISEAAVAQGDRKRTRLNSRKCVASANKTDNVFGIEFNRVVVIGDGFIIVAGVGICIALADRGSVARLRLGFSAFARLLLSPENSDW